MNEDYTDGNVTVFVIVGKLIEYNCQLDSFKVLPAGYASNNLNNLFFIPLFATRHGRPISAGCTAAKIIPIISYLLTRLPVCGGILR